jgi:hypothetical protein
MCVRNVTSGVFAGTPHTVAYNCTLYFKWIEQDRIVGKAFSIYVGKIGDT